MFDPFDDFASPNKYRIKTQGDIRQFIETALEHYPSKTHKLPTPFDDDDNARSERLISEGEVATGIFLTYYDENTADLFIPALANIDDIALAMHIIRLTDKDSKMRRPADQTSHERQLQLSEYAQEAIAHCVEKYGDDKYSIYKNCPVPFCICPSWFEDRYPEQNDDQLAQTIYNSFCALQRLKFDTTLRELHDWSFTSPDGDNISATIIPNCNAWITLRDKLCLEYSDGIKMVDPKDFFEMTQDDPHIRIYDVMNFSINRMDDDKWDELCRALPGTMENLPRTYLLRWNPAISSFTLQHYRRALERHGDAFSMDWSIWEWQDAQEGDMFYMLREGDGQNPGIVFRGTFASYPYVGDDWAGSSKKRYYVDIDCRGCADPDGEPDIPLEALERAMPYINWRKGHSGQLLDIETAATLGDLWNEYVESDDDDADDDDADHPIQAGEDGEVFDSDDFNPSVGDPDAGIEK